MLVHIPPFNGSIFNTALAPWITAFNVITAGTNIFATGLIAWNIWYINHQVSDMLGVTKLSPVILIVVESGAIYAASVSAAQYLSPAANLTIWPVASAHRFVRVRQQRTVYRARCGTSVPIPDSLPQADCFPGHPDNREQCYDNHATAF